MRIGIVTLPLHRNYGGILQNWALQQILKKLGHTPITIDAYVKYPYSHYVLKNCFYALSRAFGRNCTKPPKPYKGRATASLIGEFIINNINRTKPVDDYDETLIKKYALDAIVVGSDQIWRPKYNKRIETAFLDFVSNDKVKKIGFSISLGCDTWEFSKQETDNCKELISGFIGVSVREISGIKLLTDYLGYKPELTLDPTLLLPEIEYFKLCDDVPRAREKYVAVYCLDSSPSFLSECEKVSEDFNMSIRAFGADNNSILSVKQWIAMFRDASYVITDSYHGTIFSILFQKPVKIHANNDRGLSRIDTLFSLFDFKVDEYGFRFVDATDFSSSLQPMKQKSIDFLALQCGNLNG